MTSYKIAVLAGDGIGPEVVGMAVRVLKTISKKTGVGFEMEEAPVGGCACDATGNPLPEATLKLAKKSDAVLLGAVGGPKWEGLDYSVRPERGLLKLRTELNLYANLRPVKVYPSLVHASTLKPEVLKGIDLVVFRELTGGIYFGIPKGVEKLADGTERG